MLEGGLTDKEIVDRVWIQKWNNLFIPEKVTLAVVKRFINESIRFLYAEVGKELNNII